MSAGLPPLARPGPSSAPAMALLRLSRKSWEYRPYKDGYLQLELRRYVRRDGSTCDRGPYWYFQFHEGGKRKKLYLGKTDDPKGEFERRRKAGSGGAGQP